jgi:hypothetical protein
MLRRVTGGWRELLLGMSLAVCFLFPGSAAAAVGITLFSDNRALVRETRAVVLEKGLHRLDFPGVPRLIEPSSVQARFLKNPLNCTLREQSFSDDLSGRDQVLRQYIGKEITIQRPAGNGARRETITGTLLSIANGIIIRSGNRLLLDPAGEIMLDLHDNLSVTPTLSWLVDSRQSGNDEMEITYLTAGLSWEAAYVCVVKDGGHTADLAGTATITNTTGTAYQNARVHLVAGDVNRARPRPDESFRFMAAKALDRQEPRVEEEAVATYHRYTLPHATTLAGSDTKQIELIRVTALPVARRFIFSGAPAFGRFFNYGKTANLNRAFGLETAGTVDAFLECTAGKAGAGVSLPQGILRVYQEETAGMLAFIGEDRISHTAAGEPVRVRLGAAVDIVGDRVQADFKTSDRGCEESFTITLRNHQDTPVNVVVVEPLYRWSNWKIIARSLPYEKKDARTIEFTAPVPASGETAVTYTVRYWW